MPLNFHEEIELLEILGGTYTPPKQKQRVLADVKVARDALKSARKNAEQGSWLHHRLLLLLAEADLIESELEGRA